MSIVYQSIQIFYWLILSLWIGSSVFLGIAAPAIFKSIATLRVRSGLHADPSLDEQQTAIVAGGVMSSLLTRQGRLQLLCAALLMPLMVAQWFVIDLSGNHFIAAAIRFAIWAVLSLLLLYQWLSHYPRTLRHREEFLAAGPDNPEKADAARDAFEREHRRSEQLFMLGVFLLIGLLMLSVNIMPSITRALPAAY